MLGMNPEEFTVQQNKMMGLWPLPGLFADALMPYINRLKKPKVSIFEYEPAQGNNIHRFLEKDEKSKIDQYFFYRSMNSFDGVWQANQKQLPQQFRLYPHSNEKVDVALVGSERLEKNDLDIALKHTYNYLFSGGIFAGNGHDTTPVKEALAHFRRTNKISAPIHVVHRSIWFWYKP